MIWFWSFYMIIFLYNYKLCYVLNVNCKCILMATEVYQLKINLRCKYILYWCLTIFKTNAVFTLKRFLKFFHLTNETTIWSCLWSFILYMLQTSDKLIPPDFIRYATMIVTLESGNNKSLLFWVIFDFCWNKFCWFCFVKERLRNWVWSKE